MIDLRYVLEFGAYDLVKIIVLNACNLCTQQIHSKVFCAILNVVKDLCLFSLSANNFLAQNKSIFGLMSILNLPMFSCDL